MRLVGLRPVRHGSKESGRGEGDVVIGHHGLRASHLRGQQVLRQVGGLVVGLPDRLMIPGPDEGRIINLKSQSKTDISIFCILLHKILQPDWNDSGDSHI